MSARYRSNTPRFVDETVDGEALIMDMLKGNYYSCVGASAIAWDALKQGATVTGAAAVLADTYGLATTDVAPDVERFVAVLLAEEMLVPNDAANVELGDPPDSAPEAASVPDERSHGTYGPLTFERFSDLADLILLDPVHDVSEAGWPEPGN
jgi:hypothetical protein